ncbi:MAG: RNA-binding protein [Chitinophagaceae bacterium]|nr:MAG: RNA-binding protein [Chitinophagaceae bacterium]
MKIYIANFNGAVTCADLRAFVAPFGIATHSEIALDAFTGNSRGFGFVTMDDGEAKAAIDTLHNSFWNGHRITMQEVAVQRRTFRAPSSAAGTIPPDTY